MPSWLICNRSQKLEQYPGVGDPSYNAAQLI
jgi:hypothetical protein